MQHFNDIPYRLDIYELLNRTSSRIVRVAAASRLAQEFRIVLPPKVKIKNRRSSVYTEILYFEYFMIFLNSNAISKRPTNYFDWTLFDEKHVMFSRFPPEISCSHPCSDSHLLPFFPQRNWICNLYFLTVFSMARHIKVFSDTRLVFFGRIKKMFCFIRQSLTHLNEDSLVTLKSSL